MPSNKWDWIRSRMKMGKRLLTGALAVALMAAGMPGALAEGPVPADSHVLMSDMPPGNYRNPSAGLYAPALALGSEIRRDHVLSITFVDSLADAPEGAWDVSAAKDGSVLAWAAPADAPEEVLGYAYSAMQAGYVPQPVDPEGDYFELTIGSAGGVLAGADCAYLFAAYLNLRSIHTNGCLDTSNATDMSCMFLEDQSLEKLDVSGFDTSNVTDFSQMFYQCGSLRALDVSGFNTAKAVNMERMFASCGELAELDLSGFDTSGVTDLSYMFWLCGSLKELDLTSFDTSKAERMERMFTMDENLAQILVSEKFIIREGTDIPAMFYACPAEELTVVEAGR